MQRGFAAIPNHIIRDASIPASARLLYGIILSYAFAGRRCTASTTRLCEEAGIGRSAFFEAMKVLTKRDLLTVVKVKTAHGWRNAYAPTVKPFHIDEEGSPESEQPSGGSSAQPDGGSSAQPDTEEDKVEEDNYLGSKDPCRADKPLDAFADLFNYWRSECEHPSAKPTNDRRRRVQARLKEGYTPAQIRTAIDGAARAAFVSDDGKRFDDLELICRTGSKLEQFIERASATSIRKGASKITSGGNLDRFNESNW